MSKMKPSLTVDLLRDAARLYAERQSARNEPKLFGVTDGKAVGTYIEGNFVEYLIAHYSFETGNAAKGIDFPDLQVDIKTTSIRQPQSSSPFSSARQKIYGLGYSLLVFVYEKIDDGANATSRLDIQHVIYVDKHRTADYQTTKGLLQILNNDGNEDDLIAFMRDRMLPADDIGSTRLAAELLKTQHEQGYLTISNALQWRLQYKRVIDVAGEVEGVLRIR